MHRGESPKTFEPVNAVAPLVIGLMLVGTMVLLITPKLVVNPLMIELPKLLLYEPSMPISEESLWVTSRQTTLISTCGFGQSKFDTTCEMYLLVSSSAITTRLRVSGSIEITASPTPLFG